MKVKATYEEFDHTWVEGIQTCKDVANTSSVEQLLQAMLHRAGIIDHPMNTDQPENGDKRLTYVSDIRYQILIPGNIQFVQLNDMIIQNLRTRTVTRRPPILFFILPDNKFPNLYVNIFEYIIYHQTVKL